MPLLDPDNDIAKRFRRERIAEKIFIGVCSQAVGKTKFNPFEVAQASYKAADAFMEASAELSQEE